MLHLKSASDVKLFRRGNDTVALLNQSSYAFLISQEAVSNSGESGIFSYPPLVREMKYLKGIGYMPDEHSRFDSTPKMLGLTMLHGCNMSCVYCNVGPGGSYGSDENVKMPPIVAMRSVDFLLEHTESQTLYVIFFGGEPLMNFQAIKATLEYCSSIKSKTWRFAIVTNGTMINEEIVKLFRKYNMLVNLTIDGPEEAHNKQRPLVNGNPSYNTIVKNIKRLQDNGIRFLLRSVWMKDSPVSKEEMYKHLLSIAKEEQRVVVTNDERDDSLYEQFKMEKRDEAKELLSIVHNHPGKIKQLGTSGFGKKVLNLLMGTKNHPNVCSAGWEGFEISPTGDIHLCHIAESQKSFHFGNVFRGLSKDYFNTRSKLLTPLKSCKTCWAYEMCEKECHIYTTHKSNTDPEFDADPVHCEETMTLTEAAIWFAFDIKKEFLANCIEGRTQEETRNIIRAFEFRERLWKILKHIKPLFLYPVKEGFPKVSWNLYPL